MGKHNFWNTLNFYGIGTQGGLVRRDRQLEPFVVCRTQRRNPRTLWRAGGENSNRSIAVSPAHKNSNSLALLGHSKHAVRKLARTGRRPARGRAGRHNPVHENPGSQNLAQDAPGVHNPTPQEDRIQPRTPQDLGGQNLAQEALGS